MDTSFRDLDILLVGIRNAQSRVYFLEAVKAYKVGALRAALTAAWVALVYDLIAKHRELGAMGDAAAVAYIASWDNAIASGDVKKLLQLEAQIIEESSNATQVISRIASTQLERLRDDRHLCAHPAFSAEAELFAPTPELVRLHLVNVVDLVLAQEPLQGKAIFDLYDLDVQSPGFPSARTLILDYVDKRYLERVRAQNIRNFGAVLAKSLLKGVPTQWETQHEKVVSSLIAIRERAAASWPDVSQGVVRIIDNLEPQHRPRAIRFVAAFPDLWPLLQEATRIALQQTVENAEPTTLTDFRVLSGVALPQFRVNTLRLINSLSRVQLGSVIAASPIAELWPRAVTLYRDSGGWRLSEENFRELIAPLIDVVGSVQLGELLDAVAANGQNWDAAETPQLLKSVLHNAGVARLPPTESRARFFQSMHRARKTEAFRDALVVLQSDGWALPAPEVPE